MKKAGFWTADWFFGLVIAVVVFGLSIATGFFKVLETKAYDWGVQATSKQPSDKIAVIAIDDGNDKSEKPIGCPESCFFHFIPLLRSH